MEDLLEYLASLKLLILLGGLATAARAQSPIWNLLKSFLPKPQEWDEDAQRASRISEQVLFQQLSVVSFVPCCNRRQCLLATLARSVEQQIASLANQRLPKWPVDPR